MDERQSTTHNFSILYQSRVTVSGTNTPVNEIYITMLGQMVKLDRLSQHRIMYTSWGQNLWSAPKFTQVLLRNTQGVPANTRAPQVILRATTLSIA